MKYGIFAFILAAIPLLAAWLRRSPQQTSKIWIAMGVLPFVISTGPHPLYIALISWPEWPGYVKGVEVSAVDVLALALYISQPTTQNSLPFRLTMLLYFIAVVTSVFSAQVPTAAVFYVWQLSRMFLVYTVVAKASYDKRSAPALLTGMALGLWFQIGISLWQKFALGIVQAGGTVGDKNLFGMMTQFVGIVWFALLLGGAKGRLPYLAPLGSAVAVILTASRAAIGLTGIGLIMTFIASSFQKWTFRKAAIALAGAISLALLIPAALFSLENRFSSEPLVGNYDERAAFQKAAEMILSDHPFGIGANNYVVVANIGGYSDRAGVAQQSASRSTNVHNAYLLAAAETGYFGLFAFALMLLRPLSVAFICWWRNRNNLKGDLLLGLGVTLVTVYLHNFYEWIFFSFQTQYLFAMTLGLIAATAQQLGHWQGVKRDNHFFLGLSRPGNPK